MEYIAHYGVKRRSGRYPWGSGKKNQSSKGTGKIGARPSNRYLSRNKKKAYDAADKRDILNGKAELAVLEYGPNSKQYNKLSKQESKENDKYNKYMKKDAAAKNRKEELYKKMNNFLNSSVKKVTGMNAKDFSQKLVDFLPLGGQMAAKKAEYAKRVSPKLYEIAKKMGAIQTVYITNKDGQRVLTEVWIASN